MAAVASPGLLYTSFNKSTTWQPYGGSQNYSGVAMSHSGSVIAACTQNGLLITSRDGGKTFATYTHPQRYNFSAVAVSGNGLLVYGVGYNTRLVVSRDSGATYTDVGGIRAWDGPLATSLTGSVILGSGVLSGGTELLHSNDGGATFTGRAVNGPAAGFTSISVNTDASTMLATTAAESFSGTGAAMGPLNVWSNFAGSALAWMRMPAGPNAAAMMRCSPSPGGWTVAIDVQCDVSLAVPPMAPMLWYAPTPSLAGGGSMTTRPAQPWGTGAGIEVLDLAVSDTA